MFIFLLQLYVYSLIKKSTLKFQYVYISTEQMYIVPQIVDDLKFQYVYISTRS